MDELDVGDRNFKPCQCGYQMCRFCWHEVKENLNGKCPACRQTYEEENYTFTPPNAEEIAQQLARKKEKEKKRKKEDKVSRKNLANVRVIQKNLVYITNLALSVAKEEILRKPEYFGQYGKIQKVVVNKNNLYNISSPGGPSVSAYVTYFRPPDALTAIKAVDGAWLGGRTLR
ncbi:uncharacterized protein ACA1_182290 [Acanthamoeba castellanii str. Neff]|uniref:RRM domain-containing protein n=1 Tax=Acanthamoeba castellanii (strain ATCC 30010 / Neff) TaxID=1257118 RepID=L8H7V4_ACACF|nr:uncharacterized protein ACA1_182290 [Acanthamoeba castellanii str. Neff]ELR21327.1 hypothetical protein ACA1_182290 [Acanthamoeba castellanii str. Neff]